MRNSEETTQPPTQIQQMSNQPKPLSRAEQANKEFEGIKKALIGSAPNDTAQETWVLPTPELKTNFSKLSLNTNHCEE